MNLIISLFISLLFIGFITLYVYFMYLNFINASKQQELCNQIEKLEKYKDILEKEKEHYIKKISEEIVNNSDLQEQLILFTKKSEDLYSAFLYIGLFAVGSVGLIFVVHWFLSSNSPATVNTVVDSTAANFDGVHSELKLVYETIHDLQLAINSSNESLSSMKIGLEIIKADLLHLSSKIDVLVSQQMPAITATQEALNIAKSTSGIFGVS
jgi:hypothetical protein